MTRTHRSQNLALACFALFLCTCQAPPAVTQSPGRVLVEFTGFADPKSGVLRLEPVGGNGISSRSSVLWGEVKVVQDGVAGSGPDNSVELVTSSTGSGTSACGRASSF